MTTADALRRTLESPNVSDSNGEPANVVDVIHQVGLRLVGLRHAITSSASAGTDAAGVSVECLTESVMGVTAGLMAIARSISDLADAVREHKPE